MKKSDLKRTEEIAGQNDENFSQEERDALELIEKLDKYLPEHLRRFMEMSPEDSDPAPDDLYRTFCGQVRAEADRKNRILEAELNTSDISDRDRLMFNTDRIFPEFKKRYKEGTLGSDGEFCRRLKTLIEFGKSIGEDPMSELILRMNLR